MPPPRDCAAVMALAKAAVLSENPSPLAPYAVTSKVGPETCAGLGDDAGEVGDAVREVEETPVEPHADTTRAAARTADTASRRCPVPLIKESGWKESGW